MKIIEGFFKGSKEGVLAFPHLVGWEEYCG